MMLDNAAAAAAALLAPARDALCVAPATLRAGTFETRAYAQLIDLQFWTAPE